RRTSGESLSPDTISFQSLSDRSRALRDAVSLSTVLAAFCSSINIAPMFACLFSAGFLIAIIVTTPPQARRTGPEAQQPGTAALRLRAVFHIHGKPWWPTPSSWYRQ